MINNYKMKNFIFILVFLSWRIFCQVSVNAISHINCHGTFSTANFTINTGSAPYSFTVQTPGCGQTYTAGNLTANPSFTLNCPGVYTFTVRDSTSMFLGAVTHTVILDTIINIGIWSDVGVDTVCPHSVITLFADSTAVNSFTQSNFFWFPLGANSPLVLADMLVTSTFSVNSLFTTASSRTCIAIGSLTIYVVSGSGPTACSSSDGLNELSLLEQIKLYPNPTKDKITLETGSSGLEQLNLKILDLNGQVLIEEVISVQNPAVDINSLSKGLYFFKIQNSNSYKVFKILKE